MQPPQYRGATPVSIDLGNWMNGDYKLPSEENPSEAEILDLSDYLSQKKQQF